MKRLIKVPKLSNSFTVNIHFPIILNVICTYVQWITNTLNIETVLEFSNKILMPQSEFFTYFRFS